MSTMKVGLLVLFLFVGSSYAKRAAPEPVPSIAHIGIKLEPSYKPYSKGYDAFIQAFDADKNTFLWDAKLYEVRYDLKMETDVQDVFVKSTKLKGDQLIVTNERGKKFSVDLKTHAVKELRFWNW